MIKIDKRKIRIMTRMALYDKKHGDADKLAASYTRLDYIYRKNFWTRLSVFLGTTILCAAHIMHRIFIQHIDIFNMDYEAEIRKYIYFIITVVVIYSVIGAIVANFEYHKSKKRLNSYFSWMDMLDRNSYDETEREEN